MLTFWKNLFQYRELLYHFTMKRAKASYYQTIGGMFWLIIKPMMLIGALVVAFYFRVNHVDGSVYVLSVAYGVIIWNFMQGAFQSVGDVIYSSKSLFAKTTIPREVISLLPLCKNFIDLFFGLITILIIHFVLGVPVTLAGAGYLLGALIISIPFVYGAGLILSLLSVYFRDLKYFVEYGMRLMFFTTPVFFLDLPQGILQDTLYFNPFSMAIHLARAGIYHYDDVVQTGTVLITWSLAMFVLGTFFFKRKNHAAVDIV